tara:strand:+ start:795 stop:1496 length:702 start_codon:yes stop_codon:yes gene_type:complete
MKKITINLSFYNQNDVLIRQVESWKSWSKEIRDQFSFCIIDDCSKTKATEVLSDIDLNDIDLSIYRVKQDLKWNIAGVRNLSGQECQTEWMVILDMDCFVPEETAVGMISLSEKGGNNAYKFTRRVVENNSHPKHGDPHPAICLLRKEDYWNIGGCEEDLVGRHGFTDPSFWYRSQGKINVHITDLPLDYYDEAEVFDSNKTNYPNRELFEEKKRTGNWSTDFIRFEWEKVHG